MSETTFSRPDLTTFLGLEALGLTAVGQLLTAERAVIECRMPIGLEDPFCKVCGAQGVARGTVARRLAHVPVGWRPTEPVVRVRRFACRHCRRVWRQDTSALARPRARLTHQAVDWGLRALGLESMSVSRAAQALGVTWHTANTAILARAEQVLTEDPHRFGGVEVLGVDEHVRRHTKRGDKYVTVIIDLTPVRDGTGPARLLDVAPGRSKKVLKTWLAARDESWRQKVEVVATDGFTGFKSAAGEELPAARAVMDPYARRVPGRRQARRVPPPRPARDHRAPGPQERPAPPGPAHTADRRRPAHRRPGPAPGNPLFADERNAPVKATRGARRRLTPGPPRPGPGPGGAPDATAHQLPEAGRPDRAGGDHRAGPDPDRAERRHPGPLRSSRLLQRPHAKRSTDASSTCAASPRDLPNLTSCTIRSLIHAGRLKDHLMATA